MSVLKVIIFDLGGTLMEYKDMPYSWTEYYEIGLQKVNSVFNCQCTDGEIKCAAGIMRDCNPRVKYRECEISPIIIFKVLSDIFFFNFFITSP